MTKRENWKVWRASMSMTRAMQGAPPLRGFGTLFINVWTLGRREKQWKDGQSSVDVMRDKIPRPLRCTTRWRSIARRSPLLPREPRRIIWSSEKKSISSVVGQLAWAARQCRYDLSYGCSTIQQMAGEGMPQTMGMVNRVVKKAHEVKEMKVSNLGCDLSEVIFLSISDANYAGQPTGGSQGGILVAMANPAIQEGEAPLIFLEGHSSKLHRVVRCSMAAELSVAATAFEHGDYVRTVFAEMVKPTFTLSRWKLEACCWRHVLVLDAKVAYTTLWSRSETAPTDRKLIVDIAVLREALEDPTGHSFVRWVPGREIPCDALTKWYGNPSLDKIIACGRWSLMDTPLAAELRQRAAARKRALKVNAQKSWPKGVHVKPSRMTFAVTSLSARGACMKRFAVVAFRV